MALRRAIVLAVLLAFGQPVVADTAGPVADAPLSAPANDAAPVDEAGSAALDDERTEERTLWNREPGLAFGDEQGAFYVHPWLRAQLRYSNPFDSDPLTVAELQSPPGSDLELRRGRIKVEGHFFDPRLGFYYEQELTGERPLLDLRLDIELRPNLLLRVGQYKVLYNRERVDSSGKQQFVERSIATYAFTLDRQRGATVAGHFAEGSAADQWWMAGVFQGDGRSPGPRGDDPMWVLRWQWQFLGQPLKFAQSDYAFTETPAASFSLAAARVRGPYTRFSSSGGGQLDGFEQGGDERYTLEQWQQGFAWKHSGFSVQQEYHHKTIDDHETGLRSKLSGGYVQAGKAWPMRLGGRSFPFELAARYARVEWRDSPQDRNQYETSMVANLFLSGHDNKLSAELSRLRVNEPGSGSDSDLRVQLQWDVSF